MLLLNIVPTLANTVSTSENKKRTGVTKSGATENYEGRCAEKSDALYTRKSEGRHHKGSKHSNEAIAPESHRKHCRTAEEPYAHLNYVTVDKNNRQIADVIVDGPNKPVEAFLMENRDVNDNNGWKKVCPYDIENRNGRLELALPENVDQKKHYCFMIKNDDGQEIYTNPYYLAEECKWQPSRSAAEEMKHCEENGMPNKYTTKEIKEKSAKKGKNAKKNTTSNSAGSLFCTMFAGIAILASMMM